MSNAISQLFAPGGGVVLIPFIRFVIGCLLLTTLSAFTFGVARIHMAILSILSGGLLWSISFFQREYEKATKSGRLSNGVQDASTLNNDAKKASPGDVTKTD